MAAIALASSVTRSLATIILTMQNKQILAFHEEGFQQPALSQT